MIMIVIRIRINCIGNYEGTSDNNSADDDDNNGEGEGEGDNNDEGEEEKDESFYCREERDSKYVEVIAKLRKHIEEAQSMCHLERTIVVEAKAET